jgi:hypothetical protein
MAWMFVPGAASRQVAERGGDASSSVDVYFLKRDAFAA